MNETSKMTLDQNMINAALKLGLIAPDQRISERFVQDFRKNAKMMRNYMSHKPTAQVITAAIAYFFTKAVEYSIGYDLYERQGVFSLPLSPDDIGQKRFRTNLPNHLDDLVNEELVTGTMLAKAYLDTVGEQNPASPQAENAYLTSFLIADTYAQNRKFTNVTIGSYPNTQLLTPNEYRKIAGEMFLPQLEKQINGCDILEQDFSLDPYFNVIARYQQGLHFILFAVDVAPRDPVVLSQSFYALVEEAKRQGASAYVISLGVRAKDERHFQDGVLLRNEPAMYRLNDFKEIDIPKSEEKLKAEAELRERAEAAIAADAVEES